ncbi:MAG: PrsW family glutamic-type intramembrane protease [Dehalococcoidales bacterium]|nr:PrsW family glutamic-type intramembrane protease [Dehalococcoidales bacterium]
MQSWVLLVLAFAPGIFWLWLIYQRDKFRPEPKALVVRTFLWGMAVAIPVSVMEFALYPQAGDILQTDNLSLGTIAYISFIVTGLTEELGKFLVVRRTVYDSPYFDEPMDGIVYASASALGFASLENAGYIITFGWQVILARGPFSTLAHVLFSVMWGYPLGLSKLGRPGSKALLWLGLVGSMVTHGLFDFLLFTNSAYSFLVIPLFLGAGLLFLIILKQARQISPYKEKVGELVVKCPNCGSDVPYYADFCTSCGAELGKATVKDIIFCSRCGAPLDNNVSFCTSCGSRINRKSGAR